MCEIKDKRIKKLNIVSTIIYYYLLLPLTLGFYFHLILSIFSNEVSKEIVITENN